MMLFAEVGVRAVRGSLPEPVEWYDAIAQVKIEQMDRLRQQERRPDFVFAGTSMVFRGIAPRRFDAASNEESSSYNVGLLAGMPPIMERWLLEEVEPRLKPRVVVYGLSTIDFQGRRYKFPIRAYESAPATRRGMMASLQRLGARVMEIVRHRTTLREPEVWTELGSKERKRGPVERTRQRMDAQGHIPKMKEERNRRERLRIRDSVLGDYRISERGTKNISRIVRTLEGRGVTVVLVSMPIPRKYKELHPRGKADFDAAERHIVRMADNLNVPLIDMSDSMKDKWFMDFTHLGKEGAAVFSRKLRREMHQLGY